ncbi:MAG: folate-binding protein [Candidatus Liberibacter ctenarytainae]|uniref:Folate-binding protein n=1 Tax=Candidatus Liberibacter ctenarytainae TaxID=2020335 RepID=A0A937ACA8_9HYPH|nr:folate-binding protein [Candidatus Liberibacter ctenarytainae]
MPSVYLSNQSFIIVCGTSSQSFLQGLITADIDNLPLGIARSSALLTPQGKILFYFLISKREENIFVLEIDNSQLDLLVEKLLFYKLRTNVILKVQKKIGTTLYWNQDNAPEDSYLIDERFSIANILLYRTQGHNKGSMSDSSVYHELRIDHGMVDPSIDFPSSAVFPHDVFMDINKGVSFTKGCYIGQEVISRMQHRGIARKRPIIILGNNSLPAIGAPILVDNKQIGILGTAIGKKALAIARIDKVIGAIEKSLPLTVGDIQITPRFPSWSGLNFPVNSRIQ